MVFQPWFFTEYVSFHGVTQPKKLKLPSLPESGASIELVKGKYKIFQHCHTSSCTPMAASLGPLVDFFRGGGLSKVTCATFSGFDDLISLGRDCTEPSQVSFIALSAFSREPLDFLIRACSPHLACKNAILITSLEPFVGQGFRQLDD